MTPRPFACPARLAPPVLALLLLTGCAAPLNFSAPDGPFRQGGPPSVTGAPPAPPAAGEPRPGAAVTDPEPDRLRIVSFNIEFARHIEESIALLRSEPELRDADILLLQEMDAPGTARIAEALGFHWIYSPATLHPRSHREFGNAILSRYPLSQSGRVNLPHDGRFGRTHRIAVAATADIVGTPVRIYSVHMATRIEITPGQRNDQMRAVLADADRWNSRVILGGDLNDRAPSFVAVERGYTWLTDEMPRTTISGRLDHLFVGGLPTTPWSAGTVPDARGASDHRPIWATLPMPGQVP